MIGSLLIANRGEIACRVIRTARAMGVRTVAVYSDADAKALHVRMADEAVHIGPSPAAESYLRGDAIIAAAKSSGAEAIHPGYGFLSENAGFAQAVIDAGLIWVGARPDSIRAMGLKDAAKKLMLQAGVPVTPGYMGEDQSPERLKKEADTIGYPVLIKAVAGGGGKGMRKVDAAQQFVEMLESCQREAKASFGNDEVLLETWIASPRHIEVQVFGDTHGNIVHLFERDCSFQRRHQKVIEEAPAPGMDEATRAAICAAAVCAAKAVDYVGAGTIEFIADASEGLSAERIFFMEMNTRLQVEHPVTEEITGVDLVEWQLRVASGEKLPLKQDELSIDGHAIEARLYAEDPAKGFLPSTGRLREFYIEGDSRRGGPARIDTGVEKASEISPFYDPMIAKLIVKRATREEAATALAARLGQSLCWPVKWNAGFLRNLVSHPSFAAGKFDTGFIEQHLDALLPPTDPPADVLEAAALLVSARASGSAADTTTDIDVDGCVLIGPVGFRMNAAPRAPTVWLEYGDAVMSVALSEQSVFDLPFAVAVDDGVLAYNFEGWSGFFRAYRADHGVGASAHDGDILAPMPGKVIAVDVAQGDTVEEGQRLLVLEAMKMEHALTAPFAGTVAELTVKAGDQVEVEALLARVERAASQP